MVCFIGGQGPASSAQGQGRTLNVLHNSEFPATTFALLEIHVNNGSNPSGPSTRTVPLVIDSLFDMLVMKMAPVYASKKIKIESKGPRFELGDFVVKLGSVVMAQNFKGVLVEVKLLHLLVYFPCFFQFTRIHS